MEKLLHSLDEIENDWMEDIATDSILSDIDTRKRLANKLIVDQSLKQSHPVRLRVPDADMEAIRLKAAKVGIPYQTLIKSVLHQFANSEH